MAWAGAVLSSAVVQSAKHCTVVLSPGQIELGQSSLSKYCALQTSLSRENSYLLPDDSVPSDSEQ